MGGEEDVFDAVIVEILEHKFVGMDGAWKGTGTMAIAVFVLPENIGSGGFDRKGWIDDFGQNDVAVAIPIEVARPP